MSKLQHNNLTKAECTHKLSFLYQVVFIKSKASLPSSYLCQSNCESHLNKMTNLTRWIKQLSFFVSPYTKSWCIKGNNSRSESSEARHEVPVSDKPGSLSWNPWIICCLYTGLKRMSWPCGQQVHSLKKLWSLLCNPAWLWPCQFLRD